jgi:hypothetical protein
VKWKYVIRRKMDENGIGSSVEVAVGSGGVEEE